MMRDDLEPITRRTFTSHGRTYEFTARHSSVVSKGLDRHRQLQAVALRIFGLVCLVGFASVGFQFRSLFLPFKLALTVAVPLAACYGFVIALFQLGWFGPIGDGKGIDDMSLFVTPCGLFGLAMDYDLFLFVRVYEYRRKGFDNTSAVQRALVETGPVITMAGVLMAVSCFFMALPETPFLKVLGTTYVTGVCLDVFVIRTIIAPSFLSMAEHLNYWPTEMPPATKRWEGYEPPVQPSALKQQ